MSATTRLHSQHVRRRFDAAANGFDAASFVHGVTREGLFSRLEPVAIDARLAVDLGCGTGIALDDIGKRFRGAAVVGVDLSAGMLRQARRRGSWWSRPRLVQAEAYKLPFADHSVDVVFSNLLMPWIDDLGALAAELCRVLRKDGVFAFSTLGPDSLLEIRRAWEQVDDDEHVNAFADMHDVGDALVASGLRDPVLDVDRLRVTYERSDGVLEDLTSAGARNALDGRRRTLTGKHRFRRFRAALDALAAEGTLVLDLELVYGHCWGRGQRARSDDVHIDPAAIPLRRPG